MTGRQLMADIKERQKDNKRLARNQFQAQSDLVVQSWAKLSSQDWTDFGSVLSCYLMIVCQATKWSWTNTARKMAGQHGHASQFWPRTRIFGASLILSVGQPFTSPQPDVSLEHVASRLPVWARCHVTECMPTVGWPLYSHLSANLGRVVFCQSFANCFATCLHASTADLLKMFLLMFTHGHNWIPFLSIYSEAQTTWYCDSHYRHTRLCLHGPHWHVHFAAATRLTTSMLSWLILLQQWPACDEKSEKFRTGQHYTAKMVSTNGERAVFLKTIQSRWIPSASDSKWPKYQNLKGVATTPL